MVKKNVIKHRVRAFSWADSNCLWG